MSGTGSICLELERKLNPTKFKMRGKRDKYCQISLNYYWDLLKYIVDDYLTEWEVLKFKDLYGYQLANMFLVHTMAFGFGALLSYPIMSPIVRGATHGYLSRLPVAGFLGFFFSMQSGYWSRPNETFNDLM